jgi:hypothetical protein
MRAVGEMIKVGGAAEAQWSCHPAVSERLADGYCSSFRQAGFPSVPVYTS